MKSPALAEAVRPLRRLAKQAERRHAEAVAAYNARLAIGKAEAEEDELRKAVKAKKVRAEIEPLALKAVTSEAEAAPPEERYVTDDCTVEKLGEILSQNPDGVLVLRDELVGLFRNLDKPGREGDRAFYLEAWNGDGPFVYDRVVRGTVRIEAACVAVLGGIQPGPFGRYLRAACGDGDDLVSRLRVLVYPDATGTCRNVDRWPDSEAKNRAFGIFERLDALDPAAVGAEADGDDGVPSLCFAPDAQDDFDAWRHDLENGKLQAEHESPLVESHLAK